MRLFNCLLASAYGLYSSSSPVLLLKGAEFKKQVIDDKDSLVIVEFFATWCGHCKQLAPEYEKAAKALKGIVKFVAVDDESTMSQYGVSGFPTLKVFGANKNSPSDYNGPRQAAGIIQAMMKEIQKLVDARTGSSGGSSGGSGGSGSVVVATDSNFDKLVMGTDKVVFVKFYAPWCGHCKNMEPAWKELADEMAGKVIIAKVDATEEKSVASRFGVQGFPTIKLFPAGKKTDMKAIDYNEGRDLGSMKAFALKHFMATLEAEQLLGHKQYDDNCKEGLCVIAFIPHILDSKAEGRKKYLKDYNEAIRGAAGVPASFFWSQGGDQYEFEEKLNLSFGYPALVVINTKKEVFGVHRGAFTLEGIRGFLLALGGRGARLEQLPKGLPKLAKSDKWDGKDGAAPAEEL